MASCGTCGAEGLAPGAPCPVCGAMPAPELDLGPHARGGAPRAPKPKKPVVEDAPLELAVDPRSLMQQRASESEARGAGVAPTGHVGHSAGLGGGFGGGFTSHGAPHAALAPQGYPPPAPLASTARSRTSLTPGQSDLEADAAVLADYGDAPSSPVLSPLYAWKVVKRQRELKAALAVRKAEAEHAQAALDDALVALAERVRPVTEKQEPQKGYLAVLEELTRTEDQLRSRDRVLAAEQDAQRDRLAHVDARIGKAETDLQQAQGLERAIATELSGAQGSLAREEAKIKRAETELKAAQQRETGAS